MTRGGSGPMAGGGASAGQPDARAASKTRTEVRWERTLANANPAATIIAGNPTRAGSGEGSKAMSFTRRGVSLPMIQRPSVLYKQLFISKEDRARTEYVLKSGRSSLDHVVQDAKRLQKSLPPTDSAKLDEYFESSAASKSGWPAS